jgi:hypothetical protein
MVMGGSLTVEECLKLAQESMDSAKSTSDPIVRDQYLELAKSLQELAAMLTASEAKGRR